MPFKAYIEAHGANVAQTDGTVKRVEFDEPKPKMIASGSESFCQEVLDRYREKHPDVNGGVIETTEVGDPWQGQWMKVHSARTPGF